MWYVSTFLHTYIYAFCFFQHSPLSSSWWWFISLFLHLSFHLPYWNLLEYCTAPFAQKYLCWSTHMDLKPLDKRAWCWSIYISSSHSNHFFSIHSIKAVFIVGKQNIWSTWTFWPRWIRSCCCYEIFPIFQNSCEAKKKGKQNTSNYTTQRFTLFTTKGYIHQVAARCHYF